MTKWGNRSTSRFEYASYHPVRQQSIGHLLLLKNHFGKYISSSHSNRQEGTSKLV